LQHKKRIQELMLSISMLTPVNITRHGQEEEEEEAEAEEEVEWGHHISLILTPFISNIHLPSMATKFG
jgi:hypothetical protein